MPTWVSQRLNGQSRDGSRSSACPNHRKHCHGVVPAAIDSAILASLYQRVGDKARQTVKTVARKVVVARGANSRS